MLTCEHCRAQLLDHLFGLLDEADDRAFQTHIIGCPACAALLRQEREFQGLLTRAARAPFPQVAFAPPAESAAPARVGERGALPAPVPVPVARRPRPAEPDTRPTMSRVWSRWALAAALLLVLTGLGVPAARQFVGWRAQSTAVEEARARHDQLAAEERAVAARHEAVRSIVAGELARAEAELAGLQAEWRNGRENARREVEAKPLFVRVTGPERPQPGAPNRWEVETLDRNRVYHPAQVDILVKDQTGREVFRESKDRNPTPPKVELPVSVWKELKPDSELFLEVVCHHEGAETKLCERVELAQPVYLTHLATDKPMYQPGETVYFRSLTLERTTLTPPDRDLQLEFDLVRPDGSRTPVALGTSRLVDEKDQAVNGPDGKPLRGVATGAFTLTPESLGGEYALVVSEITSPEDPRTGQFARKVTELERRRFLVNRYTPERFYKKLEFDGKSYGAGDLVQVKAEATRAEGPLKNVPVGVSVVVDGRPVTASVPPTTDEAGVVNFRFRVPSDLTAGDGSVSVTFTDRDGPEAITRPIPLVGKQLQVDFYPEGGDLVAGTPGRIYFQVRTPRGKPADLKGVVTDGTTVVAEAATLTEAEVAGISRGQGLFAFTPQAGKQYFLQPRTPVAVEPPPQHRAHGAALGGLCFARLCPAGYPLPPVRADGVALTIADGVAGPGEPLHVRVQSPGRKELLVGAYARGRLLGHERVTVEAGKATDVRLPLEADPGGVTRVTVFEEQVAGEGRTHLRPRAERLVYRRPGKTLLVHAQADKTRYNPGSRVELTLSARNEHEKPVPAVLMVGVINQSVVSMADLKTDRLMPTDLLLAGEVEKPEDLEYADFLLGDHPKAVQALDLLLGTQGWRRFVEQDAGRSHPARPAVDRLLVTTGQKGQTPIDTLRRAEDEVDRKYEPRFEATLAKLDAAQAEQARLEKDPTGPDELARVHWQRDAAQRDYQRALADLAQYERDPRAIRSWVMPTLCIGLMAVAAGSLMVGMAQRSRRESPTGSFVTAGVTFALCVAAVVGTVMVHVNGSAPAGYAANTRADKAEWAASPAPAKLAPAAEPAAGHMGGAKVAAPVPAPLADQAVGGDDQLEMLHAGPGGARPVNSPAPAPRAPAAFAKPQTAPADPANRPTDGGPARNGQMKQDHADADGAQAERVKRQMAGMNGLKKAKGIEEKREQQFPGRAERDRELALQPGDARRHIRGDLQTEGIERAGGTPEMPRGVSGRKDGKLYTRSQASRLGYALGALKDEAKDLSRLREAIPAEPPFILREYAHRRDASAGELRDDFTETVFWHPAIVLPGSGQTTVGFSLSADVTRYQVVVAGHTLDGRIGAAVGQIEARKPFSLDPKLPTEVTAGDRVDVPVRVVNDSGERRLVSFELSPEGLRPEGVPLSDAATMRPSPLRDRVELGPDGKGRKVFSFRAAMAQGKAALKVRGVSEPFAPEDVVERTVNVAPEGFPASGAFSDLLERRSARAVELPSDMVKGSLRVALHLYPSTLADLQQGLEGLLREPNGCFEQTSTTNYPNTLILEYLQSSDQAAPDVSRRARQLLERGYGKLLSFECQKPEGGREGYEWFGGPAPPHEALTAYGLMQFRDMAHVFPVDAQMIERTRRYLLAAKDDATGGFRRNPRAIDTFGHAPTHITDAYIVWALTESDPDDRSGADLSRQFAALKARAETEADPYFLSLVANALLNRPANGNRAKAVEFLEKVASKQSKQTGDLEGASTSITRSGGRDLEIETTALAVLGWLKANDPEKFTAPLQAAVKWVSQQRGGFGGFGSTQSTILALKALIAHANANRKPAEDGEVTLTVGGRKFARKFTKADREVVTLAIDNPEEVFRPGANELVAEISTKQAYPFSVSWSCQARTPAGSKDCALRLGTKLDRETAAEGETVRLGVTLENTVDRDHGMAVAVVGLPAGTKLPPDLKGLVKLREDGVISHFETRGRELILYWRGLAPRQKVELGVDLICDVPGDYKGPASRGYLYYNADPKHWVPPLAIRITPAE